MLQNDLMLQNRSLDYVCAKWNIYMRARVERRRERWFVLYYIYVIVNEVMVLEYYITIVKFHKILSVMKRNVFLARVYMCLGGMFHKNFICFIFVYIYIYIYYWF